MGADGEDLLHAGLPHGGEVLLGEFAEEEVVAKAAGGVAGAALFLEDAEGDAEVAEDPGEGFDDLAALWVVGTHAAEPE